MGYFDLQVNGYAGVDFNQDDLGADALHRACQALRADGVDGILATIITEDVRKMEARIARIAELRESDPLVREVVAGIHVEGPFINPGAGFRGAHPADAIQTASVTVAARLLEASRGLLRLFTLAPEMDVNRQVTRFLRCSDVTVAAGHTDASIDQLRAAIDAGLTMVTHLGNGCPAQLARHDNIIQRVLHLRRQLWLCFIADGVHVPLPILHNYLDLAQQGGKAIIVTDAMAAAGLGPGLHRLGRWSVRVGSDLAARAPENDHLVGSAMTMPLVNEHLHRVLGMDGRKVERLTSIHPRQAVGLRGGHN